MYIIFNCQSCWCLMRATYDDPRDYQWFQRTDAWDYRPEVDEIVASLRSNEHVIGQSGQ